MQSCAANGRWYVAAMLAILRPSVRPPAHDRSTMTTCMASRSRKSLYGQRLPRVSLAHTHTSVDLAYSASAWGEFITMGSSNHIGLKASSSFAILRAVG